MRPKGFCGSFLKLLGVQKMKNLIFAAMLAAGLAGATLPAEAGGHEWWRGCGGHAYEGCDGIQRGPYARHYRGHGGGYGHRGRQMDVEVWHRRVYQGTVIVPRGTLIVPRDGRPAIFIPAR